MKIPERLAESACNWQERILHPIPSRRIYDGDDWYTRYLNKICPSCGAARYNHVNARMNRCHND